MKDDRITKDQIADGILYVQLWCKEWEDCTAMHRTGKRHFCKCYNDLRKHITNPKRVSDDSQPPGFLGVLDKSFWEDQFVDPADNS